jgi:hypothetical protein
MGESGAKFVAEPEPGLFAQHRPSNSVTSRHRHLETRSGVKALVDFLVHLVSGHITPPLDARLAIDSPTFESWREEDRRMRESDDWGSFA